MNLSMSMLGQIAKQIECGKASNALATANHYTGTDAQLLAAIADKMAAKAAVPVSVINKKGPEGGRPAINYSNRKTADLSRRRLPARAQLRTFKNQSSIPRFFLSSSSSS